MHYPFIVSVFLVALRALAGPSDPPRPGAVLEQPVVLVYVDFPDGRLPDGGLPTRDVDTAFVKNIDAVGSMGYTRAGRSGPFRKMIRKYTYDDYWNLFFSSHNYVGKGVHPDYATHNWYTPPEPSVGWDGQAYNLTVYGSVRDYWEEASDGHLEIRPAQTHPGGTDMYHTGIINNIDSVHGKKCIRWISLPQAKTFYMSFGKPMSSPVLSDVEQTLIALHKLPTSDSNHIEFDYSSYRGKVGVITAGGLLGGWAQLGGKLFIVAEKMLYNTNANSSCIFDGITGPAHELGHTMGFPHLAVGSYDIMHWGGFNDRRYYFCPPHINPWTKLQRGWIRDSNITRISSSGEYSLEPITSKNPQVAVVVIRGEVGKNGNWKSGEYFLVEYRKREKFNRFAGGPDVPAGFHGGALIWHYSQYGTCAAWFTEKDRAESGLDFHLALVVAEYGSKYKSNVGSPSDLYYLGHAVVDSSTVPGTDSRGNEVTGIALSNFNFRGSKLVFDVRYNRGSPLPPHKQ